MLISPYMCQMNLHSPRNLCLTSLCKLPNFIEWTLWRKAKQFCAGIRQKSKDLNQKLSVLRCPRKGRSISESIDFYIRILSYLFLIREWISKLNCPLVNSRFVVIVVQTAEALMSCPSFLFLHPKQLFTAGSRCHLTTSFFGK